MSDKSKKVFEALIPHSAREHKYFTVSGILCALLIIIDQWTKIIVEQSFALYSSKTVIDGFFSLVYVTNKGAAWGILEGKWYILLAIAAVALAVCIFFFRKITENYPERVIAVGLLVSGIIGNSIDRIWRGAVVDFLDFYISTNGKVYHWPAFNVADIAICTAVGIYLLSGFLRPDRKDAEAEEK